ncbi:S1C family serine protease [Streptomyces sp. NPDC017254]|uniref:S1C family serine protease n=1 Tax=unclassified Streptomyces TaxID=2593676 RepID=UPI0037B102C0
MSTENEGTAVPATPATPSAPPTPPSTTTPESTTSAATAPEPTPAAPHDPASEPVSAPAPAPTTAQTPTPPPAPTDAPTVAHASPPAAAPTHAPGQEPAPAHAPAQEPVAAASGGAGAGWPPPPPAVPAWGAPLPPAAPAPAAPRGRTGGLVAAVLAAALVAGGIGGGIGYWAAQRGDDDVSSTTVSSGEAPAAFKRDPGTVAAVAAQALPSVVTIQAKSGGTQGEGEGGTGTGFVYDQEGHIVTNNHVVASAADGGTLSVTFPNGKSYDAEVVGRAEGYDVAVLKLTNAPKGLKPLPLGNSDKVAVGDSTIAIGAPFGLSNTVTTGIISAKNRPVASGDGSGGSNSYMSALQTDASINPGNSGGPLLDASGAVIGINSAIQSTGSGFGQTQAGSIGLGFAIPVNQAKNVAQQLIKTGKPVYPVIGATVNMNEKGEGATIASQGSGGTPSVTPDGPAAKAGLKAGDVITGFDDHPIDSGPTLISEIWTHKPGDPVKITYERDGKTSTATVTLGERTGDN